jgi:hypothetical protein
MMIAKIKMVANNTYIDSLSGVFEIPLLDFGI